MFNKDPNVLYCALIFSFPFYHVNNIMSSSHLIKSFVEMMHICSPQQKKIQSAPMRPESVFTNENTSNTLLNQNK